MRAFLVSALLLAMATAVSAEIVVQEGERFDVFGEDAGVVAALTKKADRIGERFEALFGEFPGKRGALLVEVEVEVDEKTWIETH